MKYVIGVEIMRRQSSNDKHKSERGKNKIPNIGRHPRSWRRVHNPSPAYFISTYHFIFFAKKTKKHHPNMRQHRLSHNQAPSIKVCDYDHGWSVSRSSHPRLDVFSLSLNTTINIKLNLTIINYEKIWESLRNRKLLKTYHDKVKFCYSI